jgi:transposase InsO family protein
MSIRQLIVEVDTKGLNVSAFCRDHCISTWLFYDLRRRYAAEGEAALTPRSRAPKRVANKTPADVEEAVVAAHKHLSEAGLYAGPESIWDDLEHLGNRRPAPCTIYRILDARGFVAKNPAKAPKRSRRRFTAERANECWQLDDTAWWLADGTEVKILNVLDDHSRLLVASSALASCSGAATLVVLAMAAAVLGWPARFLSDNAGSFRYVLAEALAHLGVDAAHSRPRHPQTNGKVERFHQTLKLWLARQPPAMTIEELQAQLDIFRHYYNHHRRHRSIDRRRPAEVWASAPKSGPATRPLGAKTDFYTGVVIGGRVNAGHHYRISLGAAYEAETAVILMTGSAVHVFVDGSLVRQFTLDRSRRDQPLHGRVGRPALP